MRRRHAAPAAWAVGLLAIGSAVVAGATGPDAGAVERAGTIIATPGFDIGHWGLLVVDRRSGEVVFERNADQLFLPAEVAQLFPAAAALEALGPDHRFVTPVLRRGEVDADGTLRGDLILVAVGDPCLGGRTSPRDGSLLYRDVDHTRASEAGGASLVEADPLAGLDHLAREVRAAGIAAVAGEVIVDDRLFEPASTGGATPSHARPIMVNDNLIDVVVVPAAEPGKPAEVRTVPPSSCYAVEARVETVAEGQAPSVQIRREGPGRFSVRGRVPIGHPAVLVAEVERPADFARSLFIEQLRARGVRVDASPLAVNPADRLPVPAEVAALPRVAHYTSPPLREYVRVLLKVGHHLHAAALPMLLASAEGKATLADGLRRMGAVLGTLGLPGGGISMADGAGSARADLVSPRAVVALLRAIDGRPSAAAFEAALPVLGREGTALEVVAADSPARGHARAVAGTGWATDVTTGRDVLLTKALAGYLETASGRQLAFAFFVNHVPPPPAADRAITGLSAARLLGALCEAFYDDQPAPGPSPASDPAAAPAPEAGPAPRLGAAPGPGRPQDSE